MHLPRSVAAVLVAVLLSGGLATAQTPTGTASLSGRSTLAVRGCGRGRATLAAVFSVAGDGTWNTSLVDGRSFSGTWTAPRAPGKLLLAFDAPSDAAFRASVAADASELCEAPATVTSATPKAFTLTVNRRHTRAKLVLRYRLTGTAAGVPGRASETLTASGSWTDG